MCFALFCISLSLKNRDIKVEKNLEFEQKHTWSRSLTWKIIIKQQWTILRHFSTNILPAEINRKIIFIIFMTVAINKIHQWFYNGDHTFKLLTTKWKVVNRGTILIIWYGLGSDYHFVVVGSWIPQMKKARFEWLNWK